MNREQRNQTIADQFMHYVAREYKSINTRLKKQYKTKYREDAWHTTLIKMYDKIVKDGFDFKKGISLSGESFLGYISQSYFNNNLAELIEDGKKNDFVVYNNVSSEDNGDRADCHDVDDLNYTIFDTLYNDDELDEIDMRIRVKEDVVVDEIFKFAEDNFSKIKAGIFKMYYLNKISYKQAAEISGYSESYVGKCIKEIEKMVLKRFKNVKFENRNKIKKPKCKAVPKTRYLSDSDIEKLIHKNKLK